MAHRHKDRGPGWNVFGFLQIPGSKKLKRDNTAMYDFNETNKSLFHKHGEVVLCDKASLWKHYWNTSEFSQQM